MRSFFFALSNDKNRFRSVLSRRATRNRSEKKFVLKKEVKEK